jgi:hypothetical protein
MVRDRLSLMVLTMELRAGLRENSIIDGLGEREFVRA